MRQLLILALLSCSGVINAQMPADVLSPEDAAFNDAYASRVIPKVTGRLLNLLPGDVPDGVIAYTLVTPFSQMQQKKTTTLAPDGTFSLQLDYALPFQQIWFSAGERFYAGLYANTDLFVELDMKQIREAKEVNFDGPGVSYKGTDGALNLYMNDHVLYQRERQDELSSAITDLVFSNKPPDEILPRYWQLYDSVKMIDDSYIATHPSPYAWILENERNSASLNWICSMHWGKVMNEDLWKKVNSHKSYLVSNDGAMFYRNMAIYINSMPGGRLPLSWRTAASDTDLTKVERLAIDSLRQYDLTEGVDTSRLGDIKRWNKALAPRLNKIGFERSIDRGIHRVDSLFSHPKADFLKFCLNTSQDINDSKVALDKSISSMHTPWMIAVMQNEARITNEKIHTINQSLAAASKTTSSSLKALGKPMITTDFGASLYRAPSIRAELFLANLKKSFPGKAIIIDRWATWCAPCLGEMPHSKKLQLDTKDLPVVFVYLCTLNGSSETKWKTKVVQIEQPGVHFIIDEKLDAELSTLFSFRGYPGYAFINKQGKYIPGALTWMSAVRDRQDVIALLEK